VPFTIDRVAEIYARLLRPRTGARLSGVAGAR
ncbi:hypothetical protein ACVMFA_008047, partial [Bradyrhizobium liaoningense]